MRVAARVPAAYPDELPRASGLPAVRGANRYPVRRCRRGLHVRYRPVARCYVGSARMLTGAPGGVHGCSPALRAECTDALRALRRSGRAALADCEPRWAARGDLAGAAAPGS
ncbi:MAG: hypothetical protein M3Z25_20745 [Actinomycetota bacterium]|nr:hypothetical protein [Actinomycetota bacterium]